MRNQCLSPLATIDHGVGRDAPVLGAARLEPEAPLQIDELRGVAVGIDPVHARARGRGRGTRASSCRRLCSTRIAAARDRPDVDALLEAAQRLERRRAERPAPASASSPSA